MTINREILDVVHLALDPAQALRKPSSVDLIRILVAISRDRVPVSSINLLPVRQITVIHHIFSEKRLQRQFLINHRPVNQRLPLFLIPIRFQTHHQHRYSIQTRYKLNPYNKQIFLALRPRLR